MIRNNITQQELLDAVISYEREVRHSEYVGETEERHIYRFKAGRRDKLVVVLLIDLFQNRLEELINNAGKIVLEDESLSDNIDFYTINIITEKKGEELELPLRQQGLSVSFFDGLKMENTEQFGNLFESVQEEGSKAEVDPAFYDYLAMSNDSSDIKNSFFYSLLLMEVYQHQPITENDFCDICENKYNRSQPDIKIALRSLRKKSRITPLKKGGVFSLTEDEQRNLEATIKEARSEEARFKDGLGQIICKYGFHDVSTFYEKLKSEYLAKYTLFSKEEDESEIAEKRTGAKSSNWDELLKGISDENKKNLLDELQILCTNNDYMDQHGLINSFLELFRSDRYEGYISQKESIIYLDTPVVAYFICSKSAFQDEYEVDWDNTEFISANDLFGYCEEQNDCHFIVPHDYMQEAIGELKKALQFNWFNQFENLPIPIETANVYYNYYQEVRKRKRLYNEDIDDFTFDAFVSKLGFSELNPEAIGFFPKNMGYLRFFLNKLGCITLDKVDVNHGIFDEVKSDYVWYLHDRDKDKSDLAINADVRQALHITDKAKTPENHKREYYLVSWDNTLYQPRNKAKELMEIVGKSYNIYKPGELAEKLAFRSFQISKDSVSNEVFAYANSTFNVKDKIRSLYDNVLNPYFASFGKSNSMLVLEVLKMQKASMEGGEDKTSSGDKTALENIFLSIISELPKHNCSTQNLKDYLNDSDNNGIIIPLFNKAFEDYKKGIRVSIAKTVCEKVKQYVSKDDKEIIL